ncbi:MAG: rhomboid family intramembrane serine protease [Desulfobacteraceae bacterium]|nr:rhomboid family intramembrane serine protease [Desulfobacteraceae bacterium]
MDTHDLTGAAGATPDYHTASLWSLVLLALDIPHELVRRDTVWLLVVPAELETAARREIASFEEENRDWPPPPPAASERFSLTPGHEPPTVLLMGGFVLFYLVTGPWTDNNPWFTAGAVDGGRILHAGEWWRLVTGLTLHAGPVHLLGNVLIGGLLVHFLCKRLGTGLGWLLLLLTGAAGNLLNVLLRGEHAAVGFSTAIFGAVGLLSGLRLRQGAGPGKALLPLGTALSLLALLGTEGEHTDLGAHLWGLAAGLILGLAATYAPFMRRLAAPAWQVGFFLLTVLTIAASWALALG